MSILIILLDFVTEIHKQPKLFTKHLAYIELCDGINEHEKSALFWYGCLHVFRAAAYDQKTDATLAKSWHPTFFVRLN